MNKEDVLERAMNYDLDNIPYYRSYVENENIGSFDEFFQRYGYESYGWLHSKIDNDHKFLDLLDRTGFYNISPDLIDELTIFLGEKYLGSDDPRVRYMAISILSNHPFLKSANVLTLFRKTSLVETNSTILSVLKSHL